MIRFNMASGRA